MKRQAATALAAIVLAGAALQADTLVMRDGRRVQGQLISVRDGVIEFEAQRGVFNRERARVDRADVQQHGTHARESELREVLSAHLCRHLDHTVGAQSGARGRGHSQRQLGVVVNGIGIGRGFDQRF